MEPFPYREVFEAVEKQLIDTGSRQKPRNEIQENLNRFKSFSGQELADDDDFSILVFVAFYSGFRASIVTAKRDVILKYFSTWESVAQYTEKDIKRILADPEMIAHEGKVRGCISNAKKFGALISEYQSISNYIASQAPTKSFENLLLLKEELEATFAYLGGITVYHFMTDIGLPVLKPDRVICRIFERLGLLENQDQLLKTVLHGRKFAEATGLPIRYIDIVFVAYGQMKSDEFGITKGICIKTPRCNECSIQSHCKFIPDIVV